MLLVSWTMFAGCVNSHQRHAARFQGASAGFRLALQLSTMAGVITGLGLLVFYAIQSEWYWPLVLFLVTAITAGISFALLDAVLGAFAVSLISFAGWPICAYWSYSVIASLAKR